MPRIICYLDGQYFEFSTVVDAPVTGLMSEQEFTDYSRQMYGDLYVEADHRDGLQARMKRARENGHSRCLPDDWKTLEDFLRANVPGYSVYNEETEDFDDNWPGMEQFKKDYLEPEDSSSEQPLGLRDKIDWVDG